MEAFLEWEGTVLLWIQDFLRTDLLTPFMKWITHLGDGGFVWILLAAFCLLWGRTRKTGILMTFSLLGSLLINNMILKNLVARIRPYEVIDGLRCLVGPQADLSFPSGHAGSSFAAAVVILCTCPKKYGIPAVLLAALISFSRLYVGVHFLTDVICGAAVGTLLALFVCKIYRMKFGKATQPF